MNIVQDIYMDFIKHKAKVPRLRKKRMDDVIQNDPGMHQDVAQEATDQPVEETPTEEVVGEEVQVDKDPSFNCLPCKGEGLSPIGNLCSNCKGTGKV